MFAVLVLFKRCFMTPANITIAFTLVLNAILIKKNVGKRREGLSGEECKREVGVIKRRIGEWMKYTKFRRVYESIIGKDRGDGEGDGDGEER
jgi:hypothetical protein